MQFKFVYIDDGKPGGPVNLTELRQLVSEGNISRLTPIWSPNLERWTTVQESDLFPEVAQTKGVVNPSDIRADTLASTGYINSAFNKARSPLDKNALEFLNWTRHHAVKGFYGFESARILAGACLNELGNAEDAIDALIEDDIRALQQGYTGVSLAATGNFSASIFSNLTIPFLHKIRLISAIAFLRNWDETSEITAPFIYVCLCGEGAPSVLAKCHVELSGLKDQLSAHSFSAELASKISAAAVNHLVKHSATKTFARASARGIGRLFQRIPLLESVIDAAGTNISTAFDHRQIIHIADAAKGVFK